MRHAFALTVALLAIGFGCQPSRSELLTTGAGTGGVGSAPTYQGPGDIASGATAWWGFRGYNAAYATGSNPAADICDAATGLVCATANIKTDGTLDTSGLGSVCAAACVVKKLYDQTGNGNHIIQTTLANMPPFNNASVISVSVSGSYSGIDLIKTSFTSTQTFSISVIINRVTNDGSNSQFFGNGTSGNGPGFQSSLKIGIIGSGTLTSSNTVTLDTPSAAQFLVAGASSAINLDGTNTSGDFGAFSFAAEDLYVFSSATDVIKFTEGGFWPSDTSAHFAALNTNQHTFWGF